MTEDPTASQDFIYNIVATPGFGLGVISLGLAARNAGLFVSSDGGVSWHDATQSLQLSEPVAATSVAIPDDYEHNRIILAGMVGGILVSADGGNSWHMPKLPPPPPMISAILPSPNFNRDSIVIAGTLGDGVLMSSDRGYSWVSWNFGLLDLNVLCLAISPVFARDETIFAGTETGIFRSTNGGRAWREVDLPVGFEAVLCLAPSTTFERDGVLFAGTENKSLLVSRDEGETWQQLTDKFVDEPINGLIVSPNFAENPELVVLSNGLVWMSRDGGASWTQLWAELAEESREVSALFAPRGFEKGQKVWLGMYGGEILQSEF